MLKQTFAIGLAVIGLSDVAQGVIVTGDQGRNTARPADPAAGSAWDLQGDYGVYLGTPIAPDWFISAAHFGTPDNKLVTVDGVTHTVTNTVPVAGTDLVLKQVDVPFAAFAPIYNPSTDGTFNPGDAILIFGRGTQRGTAIAGKGWNWGTEDNARSFGTNTLNNLAVVTEDDVLEGSPFAANTTFLQGDFDLNGDPNEGTLSVGDSGGGVFVFKNGAYRLVGINYGVQLFRDSETTTSDLLAAIYDARGLYRDVAGSSTNTLITGAGPVTQSFSASYVPASLDFINATVPEPAALGLLGGVAMLIARRRNRG